MYKLVGCEAHTGYGASIGLKDKAVNKHFTEETQDTEVKSPVASTVDTMSKTSKTTPPAI